MNRSDILFKQSCGKILKLSHQCKTENGIESDEEFKIKSIIGNYEQLLVINQYGREIKINPNQIE